MLIISLLSTYEIERKLTNNAKYILFHHQSIENLNQRRNDEF